ncbi:MAG TPA: helix-turn-helix domain-containing protein [Longimicrobiales bacterium]|nr:helix-turn-helix domain-containing protein [Longimicrobiales bacterium]
MLGALAHCAGPVGPEELARRIGAPLSAVRGALQALAAHGILAGEAEGTGRDERDSRDVHFAHDSLRAIARDLFPAPKRPGLFGRIPRWALAGGGLAAAAAAALMLAAPWLSRPEPAPLYPGIIYVSQDGLVRRFRLPTRKGEPWDTLPSLPIPDGMTFAQSAPRLDGGVDVYGDIYSERMVPAAARVGPDGTPVRLLDHDGDVNLRGLSPDGRYALLTVADESTGTYRQNLVRYDLATGDTLVLLRPSEHAGGRWFPDGGAISVFERGAADTLTLLRPDGTVLDRRAIPWGFSADAIDPCGPSGRRSLALRWVEGVMEIVSWDWTSDAIETRWRAGIPVLYQFSCSPYGGAAAGVVRLRGVSRIMALDLATGDTLLGPAIPRVRRVQWVVDAPLPVPSRVETDEPTMVLSWGESRPVSATVALADGTTPSDYPVDWRSLDPTVASVRDGVLYANGVGTASVVASVQGWIADTLRVRVTGASLADEALLADPFQTFDTTAWAVYGTPGPEAIRTDDGSALALRGDGVGTDGIVSRREFDLSRGGTLELSFRLPLTRTDRQALHVCLTSGLAPNEPGALRAMGARENVCVRHPTGEFAQMNPEGFVFFSVGITPPFQASRILPAERWRRVSIVLAPDGNARLLLNQQEVARIPWPVHNSRDVRWYVQLIGAAADTELLVRDLVLWEGMRY